ncbi:Transcription factor lepE [Hyphodiscus hymeniophilus]|uniref:Transcription factor lepE n=1 Tax=Hyphodiscus hymeniophilus TaxID=353542 RepID=A0A9P6VLD1_9HELO|nr:Transcription factor lepE [Hyphodiscus hymeniophilus]
MLPQNVSQGSSPQENERKRKRDVLSCLSCRKRKLKCDREFPACSRCVKGGNGNSCTYQNFHGSTDGHQEEVDASAEEDVRAPKRPRGLNDVHQTNGLMSINNVATSESYVHSIPVAQPNVIKSLEHRLAILEGMLSQNPASENGPKQESKSTLTTISRMGAPTGPKVHLFKGKGVRTQYYGPSNPTSLLAHVRSLPSILGRNHADAKKFPELRVFMKSAHSNSNLERIQNECNLADVKLKGSLAKSPPASTIKLLDLVPDRSIADRLVNLYFDTFETSYRILHRPIFWRDYELFWQAPEQAAPGFVPVLLLVMACVRCMVPKAPLSFNHEGSTVRSVAIQWIRACDFWLTQQSQKHRFLAMYQVMCLRYLAAAASSLKVKQAYSQAENLLIYFKAAGMHRDPNLLVEKCSAYEMEMRRRLWATVMEFELQASIDRGMPSSLAGLTIDCPPPLNINDEHFAEQSVKLPLAKPSEEFTRTSFLDISSQNLSLRVSLCSLVNDPSSSMSFDEVLKYEQQIIETLKTIPEWRDRDITQVSTLLDLQLRQFLLLIHNQYARQKDTSQSRYSRMVCFETAKHILDQHHRLISSDNFTLSLVRDDVYRAALSICHNAYLCTLAPNDMFFQGILANFDSILNLAFSVLEERCMRRGEGFQFYWHVSAACGLVQSKLGRESDEDVKSRATNRIAKSYHRVLAFQEGPDKPDTIPLAAAPRIGGGSNPPSSWFYSANVLGVSYHAQN